jgi:hypothetical protein
MKKIFLFLFLAAGATPAAFAQARAGGEMSSKDYTGGATTESRNTGFGFKGGYNLNSLRGDDIKGAASSTIDRDARNDFHAGVFGQLGFGEFSSIQTEVLYSRQGFGANTGTNGASQKYRMDYLQVPVMYVGNFTETLSFHLGPQVSLLTKAMREGVDLGLSENGFNTFDFGGVGGLEARVGPARVGGRYNLSLGKIFADKARTGDINASLANSKLYNNLIQLYIGIGFTQ